MTTKTLYDKIVDLHTIEKLSEDGIERLVYVDRTVVNEYTSPQAFSLLSLIHISEPTRRS